MPEMTEEQIRLWGLPPATDWERPKPPRVTFNGRTDADLHKLTKRIGAELNRRGQVRWERSGDARERPGFIGGTDV